MLPCYHDPRPSARRLPNGKNRAAGALRLAAWSLIRSHSYLGAPKAIAATAHKLARVIYNLMRYGLAYMKQTEDAYAEQVRERLEKQLRRRAKELGYTLTKTDPPATPAGAEQPTAV